MGKLFRVVGRDRETARATPVSPAQHYFARTSSLFPFLPRSFSHSCARPPLTSQNADKIMPLFQSSGHCTEKKCSVIAPGFINCTKIVAKAHRIMSLCPWLHKLHKNHSQSAPWMYQVHKKMCLETLGCINCTKCAIIGTIIYFKKLCKKGKGAQQQQ